VSETPQKICTACQVPQDATTEFFAADKRNKSGLQGRCRACDNKRRRIDAKLIAPEREAFADDAAFQQAMDWYLLELDKAAADRVLADPDAKFSRRNAARESQEKTLAAMKKLRPAFQIQSAPAAPAAMSDAAKSWAETHPFKTTHKPGSELYKYYLNEHKNKVAFFASADAVESSSVVAPAVEQPKVESPKAIVIAEPLPAMAPIPAFDVIFVIEDDFMVYPDNTTAVPPLPLGVTFVRAACLPPGYEPGDHKISPHYRYDRQNFCWWRI